METSSRRKACDTCFKKKIKCDMLKPACSNCLLYKVPCITTPIRRRAAPVHPSSPSLPITITATTPAPSHLSPLEGVSPMSHNMDENLLEARIGRIEARLDSLSEANVAKPYSAMPATPTRHGEHSIPPLIEILPVIEDYFYDFNSALPLFYQHQFMKMLSEFYSEQEQSKRSRATWAAINVVLAIGYRIRASKVDAAVGFDDGKIRKYIDNAQKELDELVTRQEDTLGIEVVLGLVIIFQMNIDQKPASVLIGTAVRLAHRLQLHMKSSLSNFPPEIARHRSNIFWLCYTLDKDISFLARIPSIQNDEDVDLDLPGTWPSHNGNHLVSSDGYSQLDYLRARVQLACIQGKIYDYLLSNRSMKQSGETRQRRTLHLSKLLEHWLQKIPAPLRVENIIETLEKAPLAHMIFLYQKYLMCCTTLNGLYSVGAPWMKTVSGFSTNLFQNSGNESSISVDSQHSVLPCTWRPCVDVSRGCLKILNSVFYSSSNPWLSGCAFFSAFVVILANIIYSPLHELVEEDRKLTTNTVGRVHKLLEMTKSDSFTKLRVILVGLENAADRVIEQTRELAGTYESTQYTSYSPAQFGDGADQNLVSQYEETIPGSAWHQVLALDVSGMDLSEFDFGDVISTPTFMQGFTD
ncbi:uncharacterized protein GGS25DRAFT_497964 [Hypoxylon fragiforme]|uniref:uncharacterized protein n=1 Tax=Hypoxylon fragiforme TaxID=63214 RepID=UPI0020C6CB85|nr:uncharacterized protein GGS25DRAFT_497964 [Hypoxylon fragiforme]KAI2605757.1 hypothetical protein GGS25DRAFT_497964 [Hypoxylon fragiforme]